MIPGLTEVIPDRPGGILALDLAGIVGWCYGHPGANVVPQFGVWQLPQTRLLGPKYAAFENELIMALERWRPRLVAVEAPLPSNRQASTNVARQQFGLAAYVESETWRAKIECREMPAHMVRKAVMGAGSFGGTDNAKKAVMAWCASKGWHPPDHNAGDACVLWAFACSAWVSRKG